MSRKFTQVSGVIKRHADGFGFLIPDEKDVEDIYIAKQSMEGVMTNDKLLVSVKQERHGDRLYGDVIRVLERARKEVFGVFTPLNEKFASLKDAENQWGSDLKIPTTLTFGAKAGELVKAKIISYPGDPRGFTGEITEVIGNASDPLHDTKRAILTHGIPEGFSKKTLAEVKPLQEEVQEQDKKGRKDLRALNLITIDGVTAKDFDDAVFVEQSPKGFHLYVAIADVSHYVKPNTALDEDAYIKGNSSYFPMYVEPMLPEILSNGLCSLKPAVDRLCLVSEMQLDYQGNLLSYEFYEAVMNSKARVTYGEAQEVIDGQPPEKLRHVAKAILTAADLAKILMHKRHVEGSLDLEIPETQIILDKTGMPTDIIRAERLFAHKLIEELMLIANVATAKFLSSRNIPAIYRTHESPDPEKLRILEKYLYSFGEKADFNGKQLQKKLTKILKDRHNTIEGMILSTLVLRSMKQASYTVPNVGHFGLNFDFYTHFTSPIRRYPDLIVHRLIKSQVHATQGRYRAYPEGELASMAVHCSATEQRSTKAERFLTSIKRARFVAQFVGQEFEGIVTSVAKFGIFVSLRQYDVDGLVHVDALGDYFEYDEERLELRGKRSGFIYKLGMPVKVVVARVSAEQGQIDFVLAKDVKDGKAPLTSPFKKDDKFAKPKFGKTNWKDNKKREETKDDSKRSSKSRFSKPGGKTKSSKPGSRKKKRR